MDGPHPVIVEEGGQRQGKQQQQQQPVLLSRKPLPDRPLWVGEKPARKSSASSGPETEKLLKSPTSPAARPPSSGGNSDTIDLIIGGIGRRARPATAAAHMRKYSFANEQRPDLEKLYQLKRSNTIKEEGSLCGDSVKDSGEGGRLARIKRQIQSQWDQSTSSDAAKYETMKESASNPDDEKDEDLEADSEADSASSSSTDFSSSAAEMAKQRLSPPTQVQSLSEETSSADDGRTSSKILTPSNFGSEEEEEEDEDTDDEDDVAANAKGGDCEVISRRKILAANGIDVVNNVSTDNLISSPSVSKDSPSTSSGDISPDDAGMYFIFVET